MVLLTYEFFPHNGGVGNATRALALALKTAEKVDVTVIALTTWWPDEHLAAHEQLDAIDVYRIKFTGFPFERPLRQGVRTVLAGLKLAGLVLRLRPDVIISQRVFDLGLLGGLAARLSGALACTYAHGPDEIEHARLLPHRMRWNKRALRWNRVIAATNSHHARFLEEAGAPRVRVIPNICGATVIRRLRTEVPAPFELLFVGRLVKEFDVETKGLSYLLSAMEQLPDCRLTVVGTGFLREEYEDMAGRGTAGDRIRFAGYLPHEEVLQAMASSDLLLAPSLSEGCSLTVMEAMSVGLPVVASSAGGLTDLVIDKVTGLLVVPRSAQDIVRAVTYAMDHPLERSQWTHHAMERVNTLHSSAAVAHAWMAAIRNSDLGGTS